MDNNNNNSWHGTTIVLVRRDKEVVVAGDGQVSIGNTVMKSTAKKVPKGKEARSSDRSRSQENEAHSAICESTYWIPSGYR